MIPEMLRIETLPSSAEQVDLCLALHGELDFSTSPTLDRQLRELVGPGHRRLVLDMTEVEFCDSAGLAVLIGTHRRMARQGGILVLRGLQGSLRRIISLTGLDSLFQAEPAGP